MTQAPLPNPHLKKGKKGGNKYIPIDKEKAFSRRKQNMKKKKNIRNADNIT